MGMAEERTPEEEERFKRFAERLLGEKPKGARVKKSAIVIPLVAILGAFASLMTCRAGFQLSDITMENFTVSVGAITMSGEMILKKADNLGIWAQEISEMRIENLYLRKVDGRRVIEIKATEAKGTGAHLEVVATLPIEDNQVGNRYNLETLGVTKFENLEVIRMHIDTQTLYGMEVYIS